MKWLLCFVGMLAAGCDASTVALSEDTGQQQDSGSGAPAESDAGSDAAKPITGECASEFGRALTAGFGRIDGVVYAVQKPSDTACVMPNGDHVIVQVLMGGAVYRMVVNVESNRGGSDTRIRYGAFAHALPEPAFADGWHLGAALDYGSTLGAHSDSTFAPRAMNELVTDLATELHPGDPVAVYATSGSGRPESAHLVHRNKPNQDGAIVVSPTLNPKFLLFHFDGQTF